MAILDASLHTCVLMRYFHLSPMFVWQAQRTTSQCFTFCVPPFKTGAGHHGHYVAFLFAVSALVSAHVGNPSISVFTMLDSVHFYAGLHVRTFCACFLHFCGLELVYKVSAIKEKVQLYLCLYLAPLIKSAAVPPLAATFRERRATAVQKWFCSDWKCFIKLLFSDLVALELFQQPCIRG